MTDPDELGRTLVSVGLVLDKLGVSWAIGGSVASSVYGEPRATNDVAASTGLQTLLDRARKEASE